MKLNRSHIGQKITCDRWRAKSYVFLIGITKKEMCVQSKEQFYILPNKYNNWEIFKSKKDLENERFFTEMKERQKSMDKYRKQVYD